MNSTLAIINTYRFGKVPLQDNKSLLKSLKEVSESTNIEVLILLNGANGDPLKDDLILFYKENYPKFRVIHTDFTLNVGSAREKLWSACNTEWIVYQDEDDDLARSFVERYEELSKSIEGKSYDLIINKFIYLDGDKYIRACPDWYLENQILRTSDFNAYHGSSYALVGSFLNKSKLKDFYWPGVSYGEDRLASLLLQKLDIKVAYNPRVLMVCNMHNSTLDHNKVKSEEEEDLDTLSHVLPIKITAVV